MQEYDVKRGHYKDMETLKGIIKDVFGNVEQDGEELHAEYGAIKKLTVKPEGKKALLINTDMRTDVDDSTALETIQTYNKFLFEATGFDSKQRKKRLKKKAKDGKL